MHAKQNKQNVTPAALLAIFRQLSDPQKARVINYLSRLAAQAERTVNRD